MPNDRSVTPSQYARRLGVGTHKILRWIRTGELAAINVAADVTKRPRWSIPPEAIAEFENMRSPNGTNRRTSPAPRRRDRKDIIEFF